LPAAKVDRFETGSHLLNGLIPRERSQHGYELLFLEQLPQPRRA
jgi:hypothetical protein